MNEAQAIDRTRQVIRLQHKALATEDAYVLWLRRYIKALRHMPAQLPSEKKLETFLTDLAVEHDVSASTQNQCAKTSTSNAAGSAFAAPKAGKIGSSSYRWR